MANEFLSDHSGKSAVIKAEQKHSRIGRILVEIGVDMEKINPDIIGRIELMNEKTPAFIDDLHAAIKTARKIFKYYKKHKSNEIFSEEEKRTVEIGTLFSDIGKTGPKDATMEQRTLILEMFGIENIENPQMSAEDFLKKYFPEDFDRRSSIFVAMGFNPQMTMRQFWNLHAQWVLGIIGNDGVPPEAVAGAATHQMIEGINPDNIVDKDGKFIKYFGNNAFFDRAEKLIIILDKYYAARRRGGKTHGEALAFVQEQIAQRSPRFANDPEFRILFNDLNEVVKEEGV